MFTPFLLTPFLLAPFLLAPFLLAPFPSLSLPARRAVHAGAVHAGAVHAGAVHAGAFSSFQSDAPLRLDRSRFTAVYFPTDATLARSLLDAAVANDTFPGLPRPQYHVVVAIAPDRARFHQWAGTGAPEWGAAIAFPEERRIVLQGSHAGSDAGNPIEVLRHELAHLALHEFLGDLPPRWFDEGYASYAAHEFTREDALSAYVALALRGVPTLDELEESFSGGATSAQSAYALALRAVDDMAALDPTHGLSRVLATWRETGSLDRALRRADGMTLNGFEAQWRSRTRRRYGALALIGDFTVVGLVLIVLLLPLWIARRRRDRLRMSALLAADSAAERALQKSMLEELMGPDSHPEEHR